jgi:hypothetical protein
MTAHEVPIHIDGTLHQVVPGAFRGHQLRALADLSPTDQFLLEVDGDIDIPLAPPDILVVRGGETFSIGDGAPRIDDNPLIRTPIRFSLNEQVVGESITFDRAKFTVEQIKATIGSPDADLWADLDSLADELLDDDDRIVVRPADKFFTAPRQHPDRSYLVTVILDGEPRVRRFPTTMTVLEALRRSLPREDRHDLAKFNIVDTDLGTAQLNLASTLHDAGVRSGHTLSITKNDGGGGAQ